MELSKREQTLVEILLKENKILTAKELAKRMEVSTKTIYRMIKKINKNFRDGELIISEIGKGYLLDYDQYLLLERHRHSSNEYNYLDRKNHIMLDLLFKSPRKIKIVDIAEKLFVSESVVENDLRTIKETFLENDIKLLRANNQISAKGKEKDIRTLISEIVDLNKISLEIDSDLYGNTNQYDVRFVKKLIKEIEINFNGSISYPYDINLFSHLLILISRIRSDNLPIKSTEVISDEERLLVKKHAEYYQISDQSIQKLEGYVHREIPEVEVFNLFQYLLSSRIHVSEDESVEKNKEYEITQFIAKKVSEKLDIAIDNEINLYNLHQHIVPLLHRLKNNIPINNKLLHEIKHEYREIFEIVHLALDETRSYFELNPISEEEVGYLVLYFVKFIEMQKREKKKNVLVICSSGIGTSELLRVKITNAFPKINVVDVLSYRELKNKMDQYKDVDLVISTIPIQDIEIPIILINVLFTEIDKQRISMLLEEI